MLYKYYYRWLFFLSDEDILTTCSQINVRENQTANQEWTIKRHWQHKKQDTRRRQTRQKTQHNTENLKDSLFWRS
jgi:hypothetical protein